MIQLLFAALFKNKNKMRFVKYNFIVIFVFALLYWLQEKFIYTYPELSYNLGFGSTNSNISGFYYWLWFSALTQTTVGYSGPVTPKGENVPFEQIPNRIYKFLNLLQLLSIFFTLYT